MDDNCIQLRVLYEDLPDLIELGVSVRCGAWSATSKAYASPKDFADASRRLLEWAAAPSGSVAIEAGADTGIGWIGLKFYCIDRAGHARCAVTLASPAPAHDARPEETWRCATEIPTELGLVERFARECIALGSDFSLEARLIGMPA